MLRPSYTDLIEAVNSDIEPGEQPVVQSRYSIVIAASKRARQLIDGDEPLVGGSYGKKSLSVAVDELYKGKVKILGEDEIQEESSAENPDSQKVSEPSSAEAAAKERVSEEMADR